MSTITKDQEDAISAYLAAHDLSAGLGVRESSCSVGAINLALSGELTAAIPDCMSLVIGHWIIRIQDAMPMTMRNSVEWKRLLPLAAGTGRQHEKKRLTVIQDWVWNAVLPALQPIADAGGFGSEWMAMTTHKTHASALLVVQATDSLPLLLSPPTTLPTPPATSSKP